MPRASARAAGISIRRSHRAAQAIFHPYAFEVQETVWWSVYEIGQRLTDRFDNLQGDDVNEGHPRVSLPETPATPQPEGRPGNECLDGGQLQSGLEARIGSSGTQRTGPVAKLFDERQDVAQALIDFDQEWARIISQRDEAAVTHQHSRNILSSTGDTRPAFRCATNLDAYRNGGAVPRNRFETGMRFHSARWCGSPTASRSLGHVIDADTRWRLFLFADSAPECRRQPSSRSV